MADSPPLHSPQRSSGEENTAGQSANCIVFFEYTLTLIVCDLLMYVQVEPSQPRTVAASYNVSASLNCSPAVVRLSQGLLHTTTCAVHAWSTKGETGGEGERESGAKEKAVILNHFILCNDTMQDIHFGQVCIATLYIIHHTCNAN